MAGIYDVTCPVGRTMNVIGDRWTVMILRDLLRFPSRRFQDLLDTFDGLSPNTLSARLKWLEDNEIVERTLYEERPPRSEYTLTPKGRDLGPVMLALKNWGKLYNTNRR